MDFIKNPNYWDADSVKTEKMNWPISESQSTRLTLVEGGEADMTVEPPVADQNVRRSWSITYWTYAW